MKERFEKILQNKLYDLPADRPVPSWNEMQRRMTLSENAAGVRPHRSWKLKAYTAAAASIAILLGVGIYQFDHRQEDVAADLTTITENPSFTLPKTTSTPDILSFEEVIPSKGTSALSRLMQSAVSVTAVAPSQIASLVRTNSEPVPLEGFNIPPLEAETIRLSDLSTNSVPPTDSREASQNRSTTTQNTPGGSAAAHGNGFGWERFTEKQQRRHWMLSAYTGAYAASRSRQESNFRLPNLSAMMFDNLYSPLPAFRGEDLDHHFPISVGVSARKYLTNRWALGTGLVYTYLEATGEMTDGSYRDQYRQQVHYLGIPLYASYSLFNNNRWDVYLNGGFMMEVPLSAKSRTRYFNPAGEFIGEENAGLSSKGLLWSTTLGTGINYYMLDNFGIYLEPGASYYFANPNQPYTYHTKHPWSFNLHLGLRVKF